ncbi:putative site-specific integrase-resolvase [Sinorhizobium fredii]
MIEHDALLEKYEWLSAQIVNRWKRTGAIRYFRGRGGKLSIPFGTSSTPSR